MSRSALRTVASHSSLLLLAVLWTAKASAADFTLLHSFRGSDGAYPVGALVQGSDGNFYGTAGHGGGAACDCGTVFKMTPSGSVTTLHVFQGANGAFPYGQLVQGKDGNFYGTTYQGGANNSGTVFRITPAGAFTSLYSFTPVVNYQNADGANPMGQLVQLADGSFYGTTLQGGYSGGTLFKITPAGVFTLLYKLAYHEGGLPRAGLVVGPDGDLYGTAVFYGQDAQGNGGAGTAFKFSRLTGQLTVLHYFNGTDGYVPTRIVFAPDGNFYGTTEYGGWADKGTVFKMTPAGVVTTLFEFVGGTNGEQPLDGLAVGLDGNLYGTTLYGGTNNAGTVFRITRAGALTVLHHFAGADGYEPQTTLVRGLDGDFYGNTFYGGAFGQGVAYKIKGPTAPVPTWVSPPTPANGTQYNLTITRPFSLALRAMNAIAAQQVHIGASAKPAGATVTSFDGNPANATLQWTPAGGQAGDYTVTFTANNVTSPVVTPATRSVVLHVHKRGTSITVKPAILKTSTPQVRLYMEGVLSATDPTQPLAGKLVRFEGPKGGLVCSATTDATGRAACGSGLTNLTTIIHRGYYARFAGDGAFVPASAFGLLVGN